MKDLLLLLTIPFIIAFFITTPEKPQPAPTSLSMSCPKDLTGVPAYHPTGVSSLQMGTFYCPTNAPSPSLTPTPTQ